METNKMKMKDKKHLFVVSVKPHGPYKLRRKRAETALLAAFASRKPDWCKFHLMKRAPRILQLNQGMNLKP